MKSLKRSFGWILVILGGSIFVSAAICLAALLFGGLEGIKSFSEGAAMAICFLLDMLVTGWMVKIGWKWRKKDMKKNEQVPAAQPEKKEPLSQNVPLQTNNVQPVRIIREPQLKSCSEMPALLYDSEPYAGYQEDDHGLDDFYDRNTDIRGYYLLKDGESLGEAVQQCIAYKDLENLVHIRIKQEESGNHAELQDVNFLNMCQGNNIRIVRHIENYGILDLCTGTKYLVFVSTWPGSADDAATYGEWSFSAVK
jgi:hypothetical protein